MASGIAAAARWIATRLPVSSPNTIVTVAGELWALRYPGQHALHVIERPAGASSPPDPGSPAAVLARGSEPPEPPGAPMVPGRASRSAPSRGAARPGTGDAATGLHARSTTSSVHAPELHALPSVLVASEELDGEDGWRMLASGELVHVRPDLSIESAVVLPEPPGAPGPAPGGQPQHRHLTGPLACPGPDRSTAAGPG